MDVFGFDAVLGDYRLSDYGLMLATFNFEDSYDIGLGMEVNEEYVADNPKPVYLGSKYNSKLTPTITIIKNEKITHNPYFEIDEYRDVLKNFTGFKGYKKFYIYHPGFIEDVYFNLIVTGAAMEKSGGKVVGIRLNAECDSSYGWVDDIESFTTSSTNECITINNESDDFNNYLYPKIIISSISDITNYTLTNLMENNRETIINSVEANDEITIDSINDVILSSSGNNLVNKFNYMFPRLIPGMNDFMVSHPSTIIVEKSLPRKVGML